MPLTHYVELDLPEVTKAKIETIRKVPKIIDRLQPCDISDDGDLEASLISKVYRLLSVDISSLSALQTALRDVLSTK